MLSTNLNMHCELTRLLYLILNPRRKSGPFARLGFGLANKSGHVSLLLFSYSIEIVSRALCIMDFSTPWLPVIFCPKACSNPYLWVDVSHSTTSHLLLPLTSLLPSIFPNTGDMFSLKLYIVDLKFRFSSSPVFYLAIVCQVFPIAPISSLQVWGRPSRT